MEISTSYTVKSEVQGFEHWRICVTISGNSCDIAVISESGAPDRRITVEKENLLGSLLDLSYIYRNKALSALYKTCYTELSKELFDLSDDTVDPILLNRGLRFVDRALIQDHSGRRERILSDAIKKFHETSDIGELVGYEEGRVEAAMTIFQWLGTNIGRGLLHKVQSDYDANDLGRVVP